MASWSRKLVFGLALYGAVGGITLVVLVIAYDLGRSSLAVPLNYRVGSDTYIMMVMVKSVSETGWYLSNPALGTPGAMQFYDFPAVDNGLFLLVKLGAMFIKNPHILFNVTYFSTFFLSAWSALFAARKLGVSVPLAIAVAILFAFAPYHYWRGPWHLLLSDYASIPLAVLISLCVCRGDALLAGRDDRGKIRLAWQGEKSGICLFAAAVISLGNPYYVVLGAYFVAISGLAALVRGRLAGLLDATLIAVLIMGSFVGQLIPIAAFQYRNGPNLIVLSRTPDEARNLSLHVAHLLEPTIGHRVLGSFKPDYQRIVDSRSRTPLLAALTVHESRLCGSLGLMGACGLLLLLGAGLGSGTTVGTTASTLRDLAILNMAALLLALSGGFYEPIADHLFAIIRGYNRMSIYIEFMALLALALIADAGRLRFGWSRWGFQLVTAALVVVGLLDQTPVLIAPDHAAEASEFYRDQRFFQRIEASVPPGTRILQLPHARFPKSGRVFRMANHDHFRAYLHTGRLRWSFGAVSGRETEAILRRVAGLSPEEMVLELSRLGFGGIYINCNGFSDERTASDMVNRFALVLDQTPIKSEDRQLVFFKLPVTSGGGAEAGRKAEKVSARGRHVCIKHV